jgi:hypothetical protein
MKMRFLVKESAAECTPFYLLQNSFRKFSFFLQILSPIWPRAILCAPTATKLTTHTYYCIFLSIDTLSCHLHDVSSRREESLHERDSLVGVVIGQGSQDLSHTRVQGCA